MTTAFSLLPTLRADQRVNDAALAADIRQTERRNMRAEKRLLGTLTLHYLAVYYIPLHDVAHAPPRDLLFCAFLHNSQKQAYLGIAL